jgi:DNA repair exonuclease SbcCD nuclease subunit
MVHATHRGAARGEVTNFRFLHAADLHLDSPLRGLARDADAPVERIRRATRDALCNLVDLALAERVAFVLLAGDLYDGDWRDWGTGQFLVGQLARLTGAGIRVVAISGNHDAASQITRHLRWPEGAVLLPSDRPATVEWADLEVAVHGQGFARRDVGENLALGYPAPLPGRLNIGLLHTAAGRGGHEDYAPCTAAQLAAHGYAYWALGHIHAREVVGERPWIVFPGNLQGRDVNEAGAKGAALVTVRDGAVAGLEHQALDVVRWARLEVDVGGAADEEAVLSALRPALAGAVAGAEGRLLAVRLVLSGRCGAHGGLVADPAGLRERLRGEAIAAAAGQEVWLEDVRLRTSAPAAAVRDDALGTLLRAIGEAPGEALLAPLQGYAAALLDRAALRARLPADHPAVRLAAGEVPEELLARARALLLARLEEG